MRNNILVVVTGAAAVIAVTAWAADNATAPGPVERSVQARQTLSMEDIIQRAKDEQPGSIEEVELEHEHGRLLYEVNVIADSGEKRELKFDAKTGELLSNKDDDEGEDDD